MCWKFVMWFWSGSGVRWKLARRSIFLMGRSFVGNEPLTPSPSKLCLCLSFLHIDKPGHDWQAMKPRRDEIFQFIQMMDYHTDLLGNRIVILTFSISKYVKECDWKPFAPKTYHVLQSLPSSKSFRTGKTVNNHNEYRNWLFLKFQVNEKLTLNILIKNLIKRVLPPFPANVKLH